MANILVVTADEELRSALSSTFLEGGYGLTQVCGWEALVEGLAWRSTRLVLVDGAAPGLEGRGPLLAELAASLAHAPRLFAVAHPLPPLEFQPLKPLALKRLAARVVGPAVPREERRLLRLLGLGRRPLHVLARHARSAAPVCIEGERGTGKRRVAQALHRLGGGGPFVVVRLSERPDRLDLPSGAEASSGGAGPGPFAGTLYLAVEEHWGPEVARYREYSSRAGWRLVVGTRVPPPAGSGEWARLFLPPLRERPQDLHDLARHYVELHRHALGLPSRRFSRGLWTLMRAHRWEGNARELESFIVSVLSSVDRATIRPVDLPPAVRALLEPGHDSPLEHETEAFEKSVEQQLRRVVQLYQGEDGSLYRLVMGAAERPLLRLVLARTGGNQKAAAELLGLSRNTLQRHLERLGVLPGGGEPG